MYRRSIILVILLLLFAAEAFFARQFYIEIVPFPEDEWWMTVVNNCLRDMLLAGVAGLLYFRRNRLADRTKRYFPVVVIGVLYLLIAGFMVNQLSLDKGFLTVLAVLTGLNNNIVLVLLAAMCYHKWPSMLMKSVYFAVYFITALTMIFDAFYFWQTSMHVESVLFKNLNIYAVQGVLSGMTAIQLAGIGFAVAAVLLLFRVTKPQKRKPNFAWSLLCVSVFFLGLNLSYWSMVQVNKYILTEYVCVWGDETSEMIRSDYRNLLTTPVNINFASKMLFDTDKIARRKHIEQRPLTAKDERVLKELGILRTQQVLQPLEAQYDKIVLLVLESVHRDYIGFYNKNIPQETTPFLDSLLAKYPRLDNYYSSAIPTTQGLNATFRSHLIFDEEINGAKQGSLFRSVQEAGWRGIFMNASSQYYSNEVREYPQQFGMQEYYAKEYLQDLGYSGASGWGYHNDVLYKETLRLLEAGRKDKMLLVTKTLDMHQPYPYYGISWENMPPAVRDHELVTIRGMYWVDQTLKNFFEEAEAKGLMDDRTLFIITADNNPHSGGEYTKIVTNENDRKSIAPIPLLFVSKNLQPLNNLMTKDYASQIDLAPTLLYLAGLKAPEDFMGRNLLESVETPFALGYFGGKAFYYSADLSFEDQMDNPSPATEYEDALTNYIIHEYSERQLKNQ